jgi:hypothetical protein
MYKNLSELCPKVQKIHNLDAIEMTPNKPYKIKTSEFQETHKRHSNNNFHSILLSTPSSSSRKNIAEPHYAYAFSNVLLTVISTEFCL